MIEPRIAGRIRNANVSSMIGSGWRTTRFATAVQNGLNFVSPEIFRSPTGQNAAAPMIARIAGTKVSAANAATSTASTIAGPALRKTVNRANDIMINPQQVMIVDDAIAETLADNPRSSATEYESPCAKNSRYRLMSKSE